MGALVFTPTWLQDARPALRPECRRSIEAQIVPGGFDHMIGVDNPHPIGDHRNVLHQYRQARTLFLRGTWDSLITIEHDQQLPDEGALQRMMETPGDVIYAPYLLRHGPPDRINLWRRGEWQETGTFLNDYPDELAQARAASTWPVNGVGFGCTLMRRHVVEAIPFERSDAQNACPDVAFARAALQAGFESVARMDVPVQHRWLGSWWDPWGTRLTEPDQSDLIDGQWQIDFWSGYTQYRCALCRWDTLRGLAAARTHAASCPRCHPQPDQPRPSPIPVADKYGRSLL